MTQPIRRASLLAILPLYLTLATALGFVDYHVRPYPENGFSTYVPSVLNGTEPAPGKYRLLAPHAYAWLSRTTQLRPIEVWVLFRWLCLVAALAAGHWYFTTWFSDGIAAAANALMFALLPLTFTNSWPNPDQFTELALFTLGCACIARSAIPLFGVVLLLNAFNRETSVFLVVLFALAEPMTRRRLMWTAACAAEWLSVYVGLRLRLGYEAYDMFQLSNNLGRLVPMDRVRPPYYRIYGWFFWILLLPLFWLNAMSWRTAPRFVRVAAGIVAPAFVLVSFLFSSVIESRIFTPLIPLLMPGVMMALGVAVGSDLALQGPQPTLQRKI